jgi:hypothetical protein
MVGRLAGIALVVALCAVGTGCNETTTRHSSARPIAAGTLELVTVWSKPVQRPGETGENSGSSPPKGSRVEVYEQFILITPPDGLTILSPHGWYTGLTFRRDPQP